MKSLKRLVPMLLVFMLLFSQVWPAYAAAGGNSAFPEPSANLKKALPDLAKSDPTKILSIAEKYYKLALSKASAEEKMTIAAGINWKPDFSGKTKNPAVVSLYSYQSAFLTNYTDLKGLYLALACAIFALDTKNVTSAGNLASSILAYTEDTNKKPLGIILKDVKTYADDAAAVYEYALSLELSRQFLDAGSLPLLLNYANVCIDTGKLPVAKVLLDTAAKISPDYLPAKKTMAAYWLATGDKEKAKKALEGGLMPAFYRNVKKTGEDTTEKKAPQVEAGDGLPKMEEKLETIRKVPLVVATDFYTDIDPQGTANVKSFVDNLAARWKYTAPDYKYLSQYSTLRNFVSGSGQAAFEAFQSQMKEFAKKFAKKMAENSQNVMGGLGLGIEGVDLNDMINNPEKYDGTDLGNNVRITGLEELMGKLQGMAGQMEGISQDLANGDASGVLAIGASIDPSLAILKMNPGDYANPTDILVQKYNMSILNRKMIGYEQYFFKQNEEISKVLKQDAELIAKKLEQMKKGLDSELAQLAAEHQASHDKAESECDACIIKKHKIHQNYDSQMNNASETTWMSSTNFVNARYVQKIKPNIEAMYADCMRNCMLISDMKVRKIKDDKIYSDIYQAVQMSMTSIAWAYGMKPEGYPFHCDCTQEEIDAAEAREQKAYEEKMQAKAAMEAKAKEAFEKGIIPESSPLYKNLDKYSANVNLLFMQAKWHPVKTEVTFGLKAPAKVGKTSLETGATLKIIQNHIVNTTNYKAGLYSSAGVNNNSGSAGVKGTVSVQAEVTTDGNGNVTYVDVAGTAQGSVTTGWVKTTGTYETSVMRGNKLSGEVAKVYNDSLKPTNMTDGEKAVWKDMSDAAKIFTPEKPKKVLWKGEYKL